MTKTSIQLQNMKNLNTKCKAYKWGSKLKRYTHKIFKTGHKLLGVI